MYVCATACSCYLLFWYLFATLYCFLYLGRIHRADLNFQESTSFGLCCFLSAVSVSALSSFFKSEQVLGCVVFLALSLSLPSPLSFSRLPCISLPFARGRTVSLPLDLSLAREHTLSHPGSLSVSPFLSLSPIPPPSLSLSQSLSVSLFPSFTLFLVPSLFLSISLSLSVFSIYLFLSVSLSLSLCLPLPLSPLFYLSHAQSLYPPLFFFLEVSPDESRNRQENLSRPEEKKASKIGGFQTLSFVLVVVMRCPGDQWFTAVARARLAQL